MSDAMLKAALAYAERGRWAVFPCKACGKKPLTEHGFLDATTDPELALIREILLLPELVERVARTLEPHHLSYYAQDLATVFHSFYNLCRVVSDDEALTKARLKLVEAAKIVLARTLHLMGMTEPEKM